MFARRRGRWRQGLGHDHPRRPTAWTSRKRLLTALNCGIPDRVPVNTYELAGRNSRERRFFCSAYPVPIDRAVKKLRPKATGNDETSPTAMPSFHRVLSDDQIESVVDVVLAMVPASESRWAHHDQAEPLLSLASEQHRWIENQVI